MIDFPADLEYAKSEIIRVGPPEIQGLIHTFIGLPVYFHSSKTAWPLTIDVSGNYDIPFKGLPFLQTLTKDWILTPPASRLVFVYIAYLGCIQAVEGRSSAGRKGSVKGMQQLVTDWFGKSRETFARSIEIAERRIANTSNSSLIGSRLPPPGMVSDRTTAVKASDQALVSDQAPVSDQATPRRRFMADVYIPPHPVTSGKKRTRGQIAAAAEDSKCLGRPWV